MLGTAGGRPGTGRPEGRVRTTQIYNVPGAASASAGKLGDYDFRDRTVGVVSLGSPRPEILTDAVLDLSFSNPLQAALRIGADVVKEVEASRARRRLDEVASEVDVPGRMMDRVLRSFRRGLEKSRG